MASDALRAAESYFGGILRGETAAEADARVRAEFGVPAEPTEADLDAEQEAADRAINAILDAAKRDGGGREIMHWKVPAELGGGDVEVRVVYDDDSTATYRTVDGRPELLP